MTRMLVFLLCLLGVALIGMIKSTAHEWYPARCCSGLDCYPLNINEIKATPQGWYIIKERITIPYQNARPSPDGLFHICRNEMGKGTLITPSDEPPCFWAPEGAS